MVRPTLLLLGGLLFGLVGCDTSLERARTGLTIGYAVEAPYAWVADDGTVTGESPELARVVVRKLGLGPVVWRQVEFAELFAELQAGKIDVAAAGTFITAERQKLVAFSQPTFRVRNALLVAFGNPRHLISLRASDAPPGVRIAVLEGSFEQTLLKGLGWTQDRLFSVPDATTGALALEAGRADALALSAPTLRVMALRAGPGLFQVVAPPATDDPGNQGGFAFRLGDRALRDAWDNQLRGFVGSPEHQVLVGRFGFTAGELP